MPLYQALPRSGRANGGLVPRRRGEGVASAVLLARFSGLRRNFLPWVRERCRICIASRDAVWPLCFLLTRQLLVHALFQLSAFWVDGLPQPMYVHAVPLVALAQMPRLSARLEERNRSDSAERAFSGSCWLGVRMAMLSSSISLLSMLSLTNNLS